MKQQDEREKRKQMIQRDILQLFDEGYTVDQVAYFLGVTSAHQKWHV